MKRAAPELVNDERHSNKVYKGVSNKIETLIPGQMYLNKIHELPDEFNNKARSLQDILKEIRPTSSIHFNFMIDFEWLISQYPLQYRDSPIELIVGEKMGTSKTELKRAFGSRANISVCTARIPIPFGTHHTKLSLFEDGEFFHVLVSTANLIPGDWETKTQCLYYTKGCAISNEQGANRSDDLFKTDLLNYLECYKLPDVNKWREKLMSFNFPKNGDRLIYSFPGYHKEGNMNRVGHLSIRQKLANRPTAKNFKSRLFVLQCSSIGSLGASIQTWVEPQFGKSLNGGKSEGIGRTLVIYPTVAEVRDSMVGYASGGSLPYQKNTAQKQQWLQSTYTELLDGVPQWVIMTSANLSKAAWGELQKNCTQLMVRSYEMGVLIVDPDRFFLPYDYPLVKYSAQDKPWICDLNYTEKDWLGENWIVA